MSPATEMPRGLRWIEFAVAKYGRKYSLSLFAGVSSFVIAAAGMWVAARTSPETGRIIESIVTSYLLSAAGLVGAYTAGNAVVERAHAGKHPPTPRPSGTVPEVRAD